MSFAPDLTETLARARGDLRMGVPVVLAGAEGAALVLAAETLSEERLQDARALGEADLALGPLVVLDASVDGSLYRHYNRCALHAAWRADSLRKQGTPD